MKKSASITPVRSATRKMTRSMVFRKIARLVEHLENPKLFGIRQKGLSTRMFASLDQPWLAKANINTVFDIGANTGQFAGVIHEVLPMAMIYSFEPLEDCCRKLRARMRDVGNFRVFNIALSDTNGEIILHRNENSASSSVLPMTDLHRQNFPFAVQNYPVKVKSMKLDDVTRHLEIANNMLVKIDVQGFEDKVIAGGEDTIRKAEILILETSFVPLYAGQPLFQDIYDCLKEHFRYGGALEQVVSSVNGMPIYEDSIFVKK